MRTRDHLKGEEPIPVALRGYIRFPIQFSHAAAVSHTPFRGFRFQALVVTEDAHAAWGNITDMDSRR